MARIDLGKIEFFMDRGRLYVGQHFDPLKIPRVEREAIAEILTEIAGHLINDEFEVDGQYHFQKAPVK